MVQFNAELVTAAAAALNFTQVALTPPLNWVAGSFLFPSQIIAGYHGNFTEYEAADWYAYILTACESYSACTSAEAFQGMVKKKMSGFKALMNDLRDQSRLTVEIRNQQW